MPPSLKLVPPLPAPKPGFEGDDAALVRAFRRGDPEARAAFYDRHAEHVHRVLYRVLGFRSDLADLHHDVFVRALSSLQNLDEPSALKAWLTAIAVHVARSSIQKRTRGRWLWFLPASEVPEVPTRAVSGEVRDALRATYAVLERLPADERIPFALRFVDEMELTEVAAACGTSLATIKRRLRSAEARFLVHARKEPALRAWLEGGTRWSDSSER